MVKSVGALALILCAACPAVAPAQEKIADTMDQVRDQARADKKRFVADNLQLTESEAQAFWPLYDRYQADLNGINMRLTNLIRDYGKNAKTLSDDIAERLIAETVQMEVDRAKLAQTYFPMVRAVLPGRKLARYYQIENKIHALFSFDLAKEIPLIQ